MMSDILRILMIFPFILRHCLTIHDIKTTFLDEIKIRLNLSRQIDVINRLIQTWGLSAKASKEVFSLSIDRSNYTQLQKALNEELNALIEVFFIFICF